MNWPYLSPPYVRYDLDFYCGQFLHYGSLKALNPQQSIPAQEGPASLWIVLSCNSDQIKCSFNFMTPACQAHLRREIRQLFYGRQDSQFCIFYPRKPCQL